MGTLPNPGELASAIEAAASGVVGKDISTVEGFAEDQVSRIEKLALHVSQLILDGEFDGDPDGQNEFLGILKDLITNFTKTLEGLAVITIEKVWNAVVNVVWTAIDTATGLTLPRPIP